MSDYKVHEKLDKIDSRLNSIDVHLAKYNSELEFYIARTNQIEDALVPVVEHVQQIKGAGKLLIWASVLATIAGGVAWIWSK
jgi:hypothetical protein